MKSNHIPRIERLERRVELYLSRIDKRTKIGGGNPYSKCSYCGRSEPSISNEGHFKDCPDPGYRKQLDYYKALLKEEIERSKNAS